MFSRKSGRLVDESRHDVYFKKTDIKYAPTSCLIGTEVTVALPSRDAG